MLLNLPDDILEKILKEMEYRELIHTMLIHPHICKIAKQIQHEKRTRLLGLLLETDGIFRIEFSCTIMNQDRYVYEPAFTLHNDGVFVFVEYNIPGDLESQKVIIQNQEGDLTYLVYRPEFIRSVFTALENFHKWRFNQEEGSEVIRKYFAISDYSDGQYKKRAISQFLEMNEIKIDYTIYKR